ncbi:SDR family NAD(P)-dependent oxidoreductase [Aliiglaciecola sp. 2_MG-2023]|uniref:SDR family NAD(P)-dependent oxidoreductase n=1 Tax=unclassified Aliiglaciecola TaxID=2593648 RepID=UPI0026E11625|nr:MULTISPECIES: SDR family NAD(P)-dependent oxidoreductase [unclassified Aliiglaciecola]MDO6709358.1 SDR family NAD(P)-dependent oxidoreductase [Aliiglaciecola sp. 2_MG-2023]MDO6750506.1 SDR family NAD(P)-dependent oxidoreductase [Aliiglaciecola sp. 1_MG-2023]
MKSSLMLNQKTLLITGASGGIGRATAIECANQGAFVYLAGRDKEQLQALSSQLVNSKVLAYDVTDESAVKQGFSSIMKESGQLHGLVNCAGSMLDSGFMLTRSAELQTQFAVNSVSAFTHSQLAMRLMTKNRSGSIVNLCSIVGENGSAGQAAYAMSKAALSGLTKSLSKELGALGIRVNGVAPGFIDTAMTASYAGQKRQELIAATSLQRAGSAEDVAKLIRFLLSDDASFITGQIIGIDGGLSL